MNNVEIVLARARKYVKETVMGGGAVVGKNVTITGKEPIEGGTRITFGYTLNDGTPRTSTLDVMNGEKGEQGVSILSVTKNEIDEIIVTLSDGTEDNIGKLPVDVQANFLTADGFGKLRYYQGKLERYDETLQTWVDASVLPQNPYMPDMIPQDMQFIRAKYDIKSGIVKLQWKEPSDSEYRGLRLAAKQAQTYKQCRNPRPKCRQ